MTIKRPNISLGTQTLVVGETATFNENSVLDGDFRVESDNKTHMLFVDSSTDRVGIATSTPGAALGIDGDIQLSPTAISTAHIKTAGSLRVRATGNMHIGDDGVDSVRIGRDNSTAAKVHIRSGSDANLVVSANKVGIGTETPVTDLTVDGTITLKEQAAADGDTAAYGQLWVKTASPNQLYFTTDAGDDIQLTSGTSGAVSVANAANNRIITATATGSGALNGEANLSFDGSTFAVTGAMTTTTTATVGTDLTVSGGDLSFGAGQDATISCAAASGTDTSGRHLTISAGQGTGTGNGGEIRFQVASDAGASSGSSANALATVAAFDQTGRFICDNGIQIDNITIDADQIDLSSGQLLLDSAGDISLDAGGGDVKFKDDGTEFFRITNSSSDTVFQPQQANKDIIFKEDGGNEVCRMDSSDEAWLFTTGDVKFGSGQNGAISTESTAHDAAGKSLTFSAGAPTAGTTDNIGGGDLILEAGAGKGNASGGGISFKTAMAAGSGPSLNTLRQRLKIRQDGYIYVGDGREEDTQIVFDGAAQDYRIGIDDGTDKMEIGHGSAMGTNTAIAIDNSGNITTLKLDAATISLANDFIMFFDNAADGSPRVESISDLMTALTNGNGGISLSPNKELNLDLNDLTTASVNMGADSIAFIDADGSNATKKESIADFVDGMVGTAMTASSGQLSLDIAGVFPATGTDTTPSDVAMGCKFRAGATWAVGNLLYMTGPNNRLILADADAAASSVVIGVAMETASNGDEHKKVCTMQGSIVDMLFSAAPADDSAGAKVYLSTTSGQVSLSQPTGSGDIIQQVGILIEDGDGSAVLRKCLLQIQYFGVVA